MDTFVEKPRLRSLLDHFSVIADQREPWRIAHPLREVLLLVVCGTIASCDDFDDIAEWGEAHLSFLRGLLPYHFGIPCARWLNILMTASIPSCSRPASWPGHENCVPTCQMMMRSSRGRSQL